MGCWEMTSLVHITLPWKDFRCCKMWVMWTNGGAGLHYFLHSPLAAFLSYFMSQSAFSQLRIQLNNAPLTWKKSTCCQVLFLCIISVFCFMSLEFFFPFHLFLFSFLFIPLLFCFGVSASCPLTYQSSPLCSLPLNLTSVCAWTCALVGAMCAHERVKILTRHHTPRAAVRWWWLVAGVGSEFKNTLIYTRTHTHTLKW